MLLALDEAGIAISTGSACSAATRASRHTFCSRTRELDIQRGDILIGRPLGMSCGCPITHRGVAMDVDARAGALTWCVTDPLNPRQKSFKDLGYYIAETGNVEPGCTYYAFLGQCTVSEM